MVLLYCCTAVVLLYCCGTAVLITPCRLWYSFLAPPQLDLSARPVLGGRILRYGLLMGQISQLLRSRLLRALHRQLVCTPVLV